MRIFKRPWFSRFASKEGITDDKLREVVDTVLEPHLAEADLGGGVYKARIARSGGGKAGGYRVIVFFRSGERTFYQYGYAKSDRDNIDDDELRIFKIAAKKLLSMSESQLKTALDADMFIEI